MNDLFLNRRTAEGKIQTLNEKLGKSHELQLSLAAEVRKGEERVRTIAFLIPAFLKSWQEELSQSQARDKQELAEQKAHLAAVDRAIQDAKAAQAKEEEKKAKKTSRMGSKCNDGGAHDFGPPIKIKADGRYYKKETTELAKANGDKGSDEHELNIANDLKVNYSNKQDTPIAKNEQKVDVNNAFKLDKKDKHEHDKSAKRHEFHTHETSVNQNGEAVVYFCKRCGRNFMFGFGSDGNMVAV